MAADLALCVPSRGRPETFRRLLRSVDDFAELKGTTVLLRNGDSDPSALLYAEFEKHPRVIRVVGPDEGFNTTWVNTAGYAPAQEDLFRRFPGFAAYLTIEDDCVIHTPGFDRLLLEEICDGVLELKDRSGTITVQCFSRLWCSRVGSLCIPEVGEHAFRVSKMIAEKAGKYRHSTVEFSHLPLLRNYGYEGDEREGALQQKDVVAAFERQGEKVDSWWVPTFLSEMIERVR